MTDLSQSLDTSLPRPLLVVLSGPSGAGKDSVLSLLKLRGLPVHFVVTVTTRPLRPGEREGVDYHFVTDADFQQLLAQDEMLEWAQVYGHSYGVPKAQIRDALAHGLDVVVKTDVQGAATIRRLVPDAVLIFVTPPSLEDLSERLRQRNTESPEALGRRLQAASEEMALASKFDYLVVNRDGMVEQAAAQVEAIMMAERCRIPPRRVPSV